MLIIITEKDIYTEKKVGVVMLEFSPSLQEFKKEYSAVCQKYNIPMQINKLALFYKIAFLMDQYKHPDVYMDEQPKESVEEQQVEKQPVEPPIEEQPKEQQVEEQSVESPKQLLQEQYDELQQLLFIALMDYSSEILLSDFVEENISQEEIEAEYKELQKRYFALVKYYEATKQYDDIWNLVLAVDKLPEVDARLVTDETLYKEQADYLSELYRNIFKVTEHNSPELYHNLRRFLCLAHQIPEYRQIIPLFLFQVMVKHTRRLAKQENLSLSLKSLWAYKKYRIDANNDKNYRQYKMYSKMFRKLCKYFKKEDGVNIELCRYGFRKTSNLYKWIAEEQPFKSKRVLDKYSYNLTIPNISYVEMYEPDKYYSYNMFGASEENRHRYFEEYMDVCEEVNEAVGDYVVININKYIPEWIVNLYVDMDSLKKYVDEIYNECIPKFSKEKEWIEACIKAHIFDIVSTVTESIVKEKVFDVLDV